MWMRLATLWASCFQTMASVRWADSQQAYNGSGRGVLRLGCQLEVVPHMYDYSLNGLSNMSILEWEGNVGGPRVRRKMWTTRRYNPWQVSDAYGPILGTNKNTRSWGNVTAAHSTVLTLLSTATFNGKLWPHRTLPLRCDDHLPIQWHTLLPPEIHLGCTVLAVHTCWQSKPSTLTFS